MDDVKDFESIFDEIVKVYQAKVKEIYDPFSAISLERPVPIAKINLFLNYYDKPIHVIAFFDTGAASIVINLDLLPSSHWEPYYQPLWAANGQYFVINQISKTIYI